MLTMTELRALTPAQRYALFEEQAGLRYGEGYGAQTILKLGRDFENHPSTLRRWKEKPENVPIAMLVALLMLNSGNAELARLRRKTILAELDEANFRMSQIAEVFGRLARRVDPPLPEPEEAEDLATQEELAPEEPAEPVTVEPSQEPDWDRL